MEKAHEAQAADSEVVARQFTYAHCSKEEDPTGCKKVYTDIDEFVILIRAAKVILGELGIVLPSRRQLISGITLLDDGGEIDSVWCFTLFSNFTLDDLLPGTKDVARIRAAFGLKEEPHWWPHIRFDWVIRDY